MVLPMVLLKSTTVKLWLLCQNYGTLEGVKVYLYLYEHEFRVV